MDDLTQRIEASMKEWNLYRNPDITIKDVAKELATNRLYVSRAINTSFGMSFTSYINRKRIEYAIQLMREHPNIALENVASESGFASKKAFFTKFREIMGDSPRAYMKKNP